MNGIINVNKPKGFTSHDVVAKLRGIFATKRIGHTGTLDPIATGVLPICVNKATRAVEFLTAETKRYTAHLKFGVTYDTLDTTGKPLSQTKPSFSKQELQACIAEFIGNTTQIPPMYSAISQNGVRLYKLARQGIEVERKPRDVTFYFINLLQLHDDIAVLDVKCSKGAYIRSLCADIGDRLGCGAALSELCRTETGSFSIDNALSLQQISEAKECGQLQDVLIPVDSIFEKYPPIYLNDEQARKVLNGVSIYYNIALQTGNVFRLYHKDKFLCISQYDGVRLKMIRSFY